MHEIPIYENQIICNLRYKTVNKLFKAIKNIITHPNQSTNHLSYTNIWILQSEIIVIYFTKYSNKIHFNGEDIFFLFSVPHYEVVKIHSVRHTISKRSIKPSSDNARDTSNSKHYYARRSSTGRNADEDRQESTFDGKHEFSPYNDHFEKNYNISPSRNLGITDVRWNRINGSFYPSTNKFSSVPSNPPPQLSRTSYAPSSSSKCTF